MLKCLDCGHIFKDEDVKEWDEPRGEFWGFPCSECVTGCPACGGGYAEITKCTICGEYDAMEPGEYVCDDCKKKVLKRFERLISSQNFTESEKEVINDYWEGFKE